MSSIIDTLNAPQQQAVMQTQGPVLILAGAGSGKTRVITHRIAYLMQECEVNPWNILAITFTNKAAQEMRERVDRLIGFGSESVWISTFHSLCVRILRRHIDLLGFDTRFTIYDADDSRGLIRKCMDKLGLSKQEYRQMFSDRTIAASISRAKNDMVDPYHYVAYAAGPGGDTNFIIEKTAEVYKEYDEQLQRNNALDFDDLLLKTVELFNAHEEVLADYQNRFRYIMVDEYQDTNRVQFELVRLLAQKYRNLCVVGDDDQSIYKFRGADIRNILDFETNYKDAMVVRLEQNYRSTKNILEAANVIIAENKDRKEKKLFTENEQGDKVHVRIFRDGRQEAKFVAADIEHRRELDPSLHYSDFAVLYRTNAQSRPLEEEFVQDSIPYNIVGGHNFYDRMEIRDILSYLRTIDNGRDDVNTQRIINVPKRGIGASTIDRVQSYAEEHGISFFAALEEADQIPGITRALKKIADFVTLIRDLRTFADTNDVESTVEEVIRRIGYEDYLRSYEKDTADERIENVNELISKAASYEEDTAKSGEETPSLAGFLEEVSLVAEIDQVEGSDDRVLLMTLHSAKGLEFMDVYITGMEEDLFPSYHSTLDPTGKDLEEERRLAYVGITRAKKELTLTAANYRMRRGQIWPETVSRFIDDLPAEVVETKEQDRDFMDVTGAFAKVNTKKKALPPAEDRKEIPSRAAVPAVAGKSAEEGGAKIAAKYTKGEGALPEAGTAKTGRPGRPKAVYTKPHTDEAKKPYSARRQSITLTKGAPVMEKPEYTVGDRVHHIKYGDGTVKAMEQGPKDWKVTVLFDDPETGQKIMYAAFAKLQKI